MWPGEKKLKDIKVDRNDVRSLRAALNQMEHHSAIVRAVADTALWRGLNGEDKYTVLAYELLLQNEHLHELALNMVNTRPPAIVVQGPLKPGDIIWKPNVDMEDALLRVWRILLQNTPGSGHSAMIMARTALINAGRVRETAPGRFDVVKRD